jgi:uncharacterized membrane protein
LHKASGSTWRRRPASLCLEHIDEATARPRGAASPTKKLWEARVTDGEDGHHGFGEEDARLLKRLRAARRRQRAAPEGPPPTPGQRIADGVAATMGSWPFIIVQTTILAFWILLNVLAWIRHWDPYPFILLNLALSFQAAYAAPFIMMSQNRQQDVDRRKAGDDYKVNIKAELEIELLHQKLDELREREILSLVRSIEALAAMLEKSAAAKGSEG